MAMAVTRRAFAGDGRMAIWRRSRCSRSPPWQTRLTSSASKAPVRFTSTRMAGLCISAIVQAWPRRPVLEWRMWTARWCSAAAKAISRCSPSTSRPASMIFSRKRFPLFGIMLWAEPSEYSTDTAFVPSLDRRYPLAQPVGDNLGDLQVILLQHHEVAVAMNSEVSEADEIIIDASLLQIGRVAMGGRHGERCFGVQQQNGNILEIGKLPRWLLLAPAPGEIRRIGFLLPLDGDFRRIVDRW